MSLEPLLGPVLLSQRLSDLAPLSWVIVGGESGPGARPCHPDWVRSIRDPCAAAGVPLFVKQLQIDGKINRKMDEWPEDLRIREWAR